MVAAVPSGIALQSTSDASQSTFGEERERLFNDNERLSIAFPGDRWIGEEVFPPGTDDPYTVTNRKHEHPGAPLDGAYIVEMLPVYRQDVRRKYDRKVQIDAVSALRHYLPQYSEMTIFPDGFVHLDTMLREEAKNKGLSDGQQELRIAKFRRSFMNTPIDEVGVRVTIVYLARAKHWKMRESDGPWREQARGPVCTTQTSECDIARGFYIRVESGMSERVHRRCLMSLYRQKFTPDHPLWQDWLYHGTLQKFADSLCQAGLICGGLARPEATKRSEIHWENE